jgi:hypothetical protein
MSKQQVPKYGGKARSLRNLLVPNGKSAKERAELLARDEIIEPGIPSAVLIQEARNVHQYAQLDRVELENVGQAMVMIDELPQWAELLRTAEAAWWVARFHRPIQEEYARAMAEAKELRDDVERKARFGFEGDEKMMKRIAWIEEEQQDLPDAEEAIDLGTWGNLVAQTPDRFAAIGIPPETADRLKRTSTRLFKLRADAQGEDLAAGQVRIRRNRAYTLLSATLSELRRCAKFAFNNDRKRLKGYMSEYARKSSHVARPHLARRRSEDRE